MIAIKGWQKNDEKLMKIQYLVGECPDILDELMLKRNTGEKFNIEIKTIQQKYK